jgi:beta-phosphoglucomutase
MELVGHVMHSSTESPLPRPCDELQAIYDGTTDGILVAELAGRRFIRANTAICRMLGYSEKEILSLSIDDIHPPESLPHILGLCQTASERRLERLHGIPCLHKDGGIIHVDFSAAHVTSASRPCIVGLFHTHSEQKLGGNLPHAGDDRHRLIADNVGDVVWTVDFPGAAIRQTLKDVGPAAAVDVAIDHWRFSFVSPAAERLSKYSSAELASLSIRDFASPESLAHVRKAMIERFGQSDTAVTMSPKHSTSELKLIAKDGSSRWCEVVCTYVRDDHGVPVGMLGVTRDVTGRHEAEEALRESEAKLRSLFENIPDIVVVVDRDGNVRFINHGLQPSDIRTMLGVSIFTFIAPEHQAVLRRSLDQAISSGLPQIAEAQDILGRWWSCRVVPLVTDNGTKGVSRVMVVCTNITEERRAVEAIKKEQQLLRRLLDLHERERQLIAYEIHDGFAQQLAGALLRLQAFRETLSRDPVEAWKGFDSASQLIGRAIDETRRLISGLRPPILDEMGVFEAVQYLIYEHRKNGGPEIEFDHNMGGERFPPPLENAIFRIVQESLNNARRHSRSDRVGVSIIRREDYIYIDVRDWGIGFDVGAIEEQRFGLQGIRERVRLLDGSVAIESTPREGTHISVKLPLTGAESVQAVIFDMDGVLVDSYRAHYQSWVELAEAEGLHLTETEFAVLFGRTSREIIARLWGNDRYDDAQIAELDFRKEAAFRRVIENDFPAMSGACELIQSLHDAGFRLAVGSSGPPENVAFVLDRLGVGDLFDAIVTGEDVARGKPNPEVFLTAAKRLGVPPNSCAVIEDAPAGVAAANAAGMLSVGLLSTGWKLDDLAAANIVVHSLDELSPQIVRNVITSQQSTETP